MSYLSWDERYSVGIKMMDDHHQRLFDLINELHEAMKSGKGKETSSRIVKELYDYTIFHFTKEESLLRESNSDHLAEQQAQHKIFIDKVKELQQKIDTGKQVTVSIEILTFLNDWLRNHIQGTDKKYTSDMSKVAH